MSKELRNLIIFGVIAIVSVLIYAHYERSQESKAGVVTQPNKADVGESTISNLTTPAEPEHADNVVIHDNPFSRRDPTLAVVYQNAPSGGIQVRTKPNIPTENVLATSSTVVTPSKQYDEEQEEDTPLLDESELLQDYVVMTEAQKLQSDSFKWMVEVEARQKFNADKDDVEVTSSSMRTGKPSDKYYTYYYTLKVLGYPTEAKVVVSKADDNKYTLSITQ